MSTEQVAEILGLSARKVRLLCQTGELSHHRIGRTYRMSQRHVDDFLDRTERAAEMSDVMERLAALRRRARRR